MLDIYYHADGRGAKAGKKASGSARNVARSMVDKKSLARWWRRILILC